MRALVDIVENLTSSVRYIFGAIVLGIMVVGLMMTAGASYVGTKAVDSIGDRVERVSQEAIKAEFEARRAEELAKDGWGYRPSDADPAAKRSPSSESAKNGWGN